MIAQSTNKIKKHKTTFTGIVRYMPNVYR